METEVSQAGLFGCIENHVKVLFLSGGQKFGHGHAERDHMCGASNSERLACPRSVT